MSQRNARRDLTDDASKTPRTQEHAHECACAATFLATTVSDQYHARDTEVGREQGTADLYENVFLFT